MTNTISFSHGVAYYIATARGAWVAQSVKRPTWAQIMISRFMSSTPVSGSVLTTQNLERASGSVSLSLSAPPLPMLRLLQKHTIT